MGTLSALATLLAWHRLAWWRHLGLVLLLVLKSAPVWGWPFVLAAAVAALARGAHDGARPLACALAAAAVALALNPPLHRWYVARTSALARGLEERLRGDLLAVAHALPAEELDRLDSGAAQAVVVRDVEQVAALAQAWWHQHLLTLLTAAVAAATTAWREPRMLVAYVVLLPPATLLGVWAVARLEGHHARYRGLVETVGAAVGDALRTLPVARAHGVEAARLAVAGVGLARLRRRGAAIDGAAAWVDGTLWSAFEALRLLQLAWLAWTCWSGRCSVADVVLLHGLFAGLVGAVGALVWALPGVQAGCASVAAVRAALARPTASPGRRRPARPRGEIALIAAGYRYPGRGEPALIDVDLRVAAGERVAIAGASGSGKSTLVQLALGLRLPTTGEALLDGVPAHELDLAWWRRHVAVVAQRVALADATVRDNVVFGTPGVGDAAVRAALEAVGLDELVARLTGGLEARLGEDGGRLSGGQRQRLAIARALVRDPRLVVLDEANAALDAATELRVQAALDRLCAGRTVLVASHRESALRAADRVVLLAGGRVAAAGSFASIAPLVRANLDDQGAAA